MSHLEGILVDVATDFPLNEYDTASKSFFGDAVNAVARASNQILGQIGRETVDVIATSVNTLDDGTMIQHEPLLASAKFEMSISKAVAGDLDDVHAAVVEAADQFVTSMMPKFFEQIGALCDATGNVTTHGDQPLAEAVLEMIEKVDISFDREGKPNLPTMVVPPGTNVDLGADESDYQERFDAIIERKRNEWMATRRTRRLPRQRD